MTTIPTGEIKIKVMQNIWGGEVVGGGGKQGVLWEMCKWRIHLIWEIHTVENNFHYTLIFTSSCKKQDGRMRKTGFIYPRIFLLFLDFLFLMRSCKASNLDSERHFIECFHSRGQHLCRFIGTKESVCIRKEFNSQRIDLGHQHGCRFIVLGHQYGRRDVMWKHSIVFFR